MKSFVMFAKTAYGINKELWISRSDPGLFMTSGVLGR